MENAKTLACSECGCEFTKQCDDNAAAAMHRIFPNTKREYRPICDDCYSKKLWKDSEMKGVTDGPD